VLYTAHSRQYSRLTEVSTPSLRNVLVGVVTVIAAALIMGGWASKESVAQHREDIAVMRSERRATVDSIKSDIRAYRVADSAQYAKLYEMNLETLCTVKPAARQCRQN
jgi:hypothetical protein